MPNTSLKKAPALSQTSLHFARPGLISYNRVTLATLGYKGCLETAGHSVLVAKGEWTLEGEATEPGIAGEGLRAQGLECERWVAFRRETGKRRDVGSNLWKQWPVWEAVRTLLQEIFVLGSWKKVGPLMCVQFPEEPPALPHPQHIPRPLLPSQCLPGLI